jgi:hypothetical protein
MEIPAEHHLGIDGNLQPGLFRDSEVIAWKREWHDMPEYDVRDLSPKYQIIVSFACAADLEDFGTIIGHKIAASSGRQKQSIWFPEAEIGRIANKRYIGGAP